MPLPKPKHIAKTLPLNNVWNRTREYNQNYLAAVCGQTGSGKSWAALSMAYYTDVTDTEKSRFSIDRVVFCAEDFIALVQKKLPKGSFIIWDEVGIGINSRTFYEQQNLNISYVTQTFRSKNYAVLYTVPAFSYIDKQVRQLFHAYFQMTNIDYNNKISYARYFDIVYNPRTGLIRYPQPRYTNDDGLKCSFNKIGFTKPPPDLIDAYESKKEEHLTKQYAQYHEEITNKNEKKSNRVTIEEIKQKVLDKPEDFTNTRGNIDPGIIFGEFGIGDNAARKIATWANKRLQG